jgi:hypothetical protein
MEASHFQISHSEASVSRMPPQLEIPNGYENATADEILNSMSEIIAKYLLDFMRTYRPAPLQRSQHYLLVM